MMKRGTFILSALALFPLSIFAKIKTNIFMRTEKAFKVKAGEARFGEHYKMKGVTLNNLDIKISGTDTENDLAVFEQTGLTPNGGPPLHIPLSRTNGFMLLKESICFR
ncbi:MAG TPA: hypothetical protein PLI47_07790 [Bacteroidia bacterium]|nr:hypothetical protein [Bacteroidia bacterium]